MEIEIHFTLENPLLLLSCGKHPLFPTIIWEYLPLAQPPHASLIRHRGIAPSDVSWDVFQYVALVDSGEKSSSTSMSLGEPQRKNERLITLTTYVILRLGSSSIPTPYRKQKISIQNLSTDSNATFVAIFPVTCRCCFVIRLTGKSSFK